MLRRKYHIFSMPLLERNKSKIYTEEDFRVLNLIASSSLKAIEEAKSQLECYYCFNPNFIIDDYCFIDVTSEVRKRGDYAVCKDYWNEYKEQVHLQNDGIKRAYYEQLSKENYPLELRMSSKSLLHQLSDEKLKIVYYKAISNSFNIIRELGFRLSNVRKNFQDTYIHASLLIDIGHTFHNSRLSTTYGPEVKDNMITDLLEYEEWILVFLALESRLGLNGLALWIDSNCKISDIIEKYVSEEKRNLAGNF